MHQDRAGACRRAGWSIVIDVPREFAVMPLSRLRHHPHNARQGDVGAIVASIEQFGFAEVVKVVANEDGRTYTIIAGNHTVKAARQLGMTEVPVVVVDMPEGAIVPFMVAHNRASDLASWDEAMLTEQLRAIAAVDANLLTATGFDGDDVDDLVMRQEARAKPEPPADWLTRCTVQKMTIYSRKGVRREPGAHRTIARALKAWRPRPPAIPPPWPRRLRTYAPRSTW